MAFNKYPRGLRVNMPSGYILGRSSKGSGRAELIKFKGLGAGGGGSSSTAAGSTSEGFGFFNDALMGANELLGGAVFDTDLTFPGGTYDIRCLVPATADAVLHVTSTVGGIETTRAAITFLAGAFTATIVWTPTPYVLPFGTMLRLYAPSSADASLSFISGRIPAA